MERKKIGGILTKAVLLCHTVRFDLFLRVRKYDTGLYTSLSKVTIFICVSNGKGTNGTGQNATRWKQ